MITLQDVKLQLRIDNDAEDALLDKYMRASEHYMRSAVDNYVDNEAMDMARLALITEMYEHRIPSDDKERDYSYTIKSIITQLQYAGGEEDDNG